MSRESEPLRKFTLEDLTKKVFDLELFIDKHNHETGTQNIPANAIQDGTVSGFLQSQNFITGVNGSGWKLFPDGAIEANEGNFRGDITGSTGTFSGSITIGTGNNVVKADGTDGLWVGHANFDSAPFKVSLAGAITSTSGKVGGFDIGADHIRDLANSMGMASVVSGGDNVRFWAGDTFANRASASFRVTEAGVLIATSATITGGDFTSSELNNDVVDTAQIVALAVTNAEINDLDVSKLTAGTITSKTISLAIAAGTGDVYIAAGKTDFTNVDAGFILGLDDSDGDLAKFFIGTSSVYFNWDGANLTVVGGTITGGTIQTSTSGARIVMAADVLQSYDSSGVKRLEIIGDLIQIGESGGSLATVLTGFANAVTANGELGISLYDTDSPFSLLTTLRLGIDGFTPGVSIPLGLTGNRWSDLWLSGDADIDGALNIQGTGTFQGTVNIIGALDVNSTLNIQGVSTFQANILPSAAGKDLGASAAANRWAVGYINKISGLGIANVIDFGITGRIATNQDFTFANITSEGSPPAGTMHWNSSTVTMRIFNGTAWESITVT